MVEMRQGLLIAALLEAGLWVCPVNPKTVDRTRPASGAKSDRSTRCCWRGRGAVLARSATAAAGLPAAGGAQSAHARPGQSHPPADAARQPLTACLKAYYPVALELFDKLTRPVAQAFLSAFPTLEEARAASEEEVRQCCARAHCPSSAHKAARFCAILRRAQLAASPALARAKARYALALGRPTGAHPPATPGVRPRHWEALPPACG